MDEMIAHYEDTKSNTFFSQLINLNQKGSDSLIIFKKSHKEFPRIAPHTTRKKDIGEGHACDRPLRSVTNVTYGDGP